MVSHLFPPAQGFWCFSCLRRYLLQIKPDVITAWGTLALLSRSIDESSLPVSYQIHFRVIIAVFLSDWLFLFPPTPSAVKEIGQEAQRDAEQHPPRDDGDGQLHGQELHGAGDQLWWGAVLHGHAQPHAEHAQRVRVDVEHAQRVRAHAQRPQRVHPHRQRAR